MRFGEAWNTRLESKKRPMQTLPDWAKIPIFLLKMWPNPCKISKKLPEKYEKWRFGRWILITASPNALESKTDEEISAYFSDALRYLQDKHGAENVVYAGIHRDETTPHMYAYIVPLDERGKLNCHKFYGAKNALSDLQTDFFEQVGHKHGLDRGIKGSKAKHTKIRDYYARVNAVEDLQIEPDADIEFPSPTLVDKAKTYDYGYKVAESVTAQLTKQYESQLKAAAIKYQNKLHEKDLQVSWSRNYGTARAGKMTSWLQKSGFNRKTDWFWKYKIAAKWGSSKDFAAWKHHKTI